MQKENELPLKNLQHWMQAVLINPLGFAQESPFQQLPPELQQGKIEDIIKPSKRLSARQHLAIYQQSYLARLRNCMANQFSALAYALGAELFQHFADQYLQSYPSGSYTLMDLGKRFPDFLEETRPDAQLPEKESWPDFMIELARFEYAILNIFDEKVDDAAEGKKLPPDINTADEALQLPIVFHIFKHQYPIGMYYQQFVHDKKPELPFPEKSFSVVLRKNFRLGLFNLNEDQYDFLNDWQSTDSFAEAKKQLLQKRNLSTEQFDKAWHSWKSKWLESGFFG